MASVWSGNAIERCERSLNIFPRERNAWHVFMAYKRSYRNSYIWQDVSDDDFVAPIRSGEYVLKGSEISDRNKEKMPKQAANYYMDYAKHPELLNRKYRGAETWLKVEGRQRLSALFRFSRVS